ncbi:unnamed protein product [Rhodiola kirilowii]
MTTTTAGLISRITFSSDKDSKRLKSWFEKNREKKNEGNSKQQSELLRFHCVKNEVVEIPSNLAWLSEDRTTGHLPSQEDMM